MKVNAGQASSTLIPEYIGSDFDKVIEVADNIEYVKEVAAVIEGLPVHGYIGDIPPTHPKAGVEWYCTTDGRTYIWYEDVDSKQWVESSPQSTVEVNPSTAHVVATNTANIFSLWKHSAAEAGLNLVAGSFEEGGVLTSSTDVLLHKESKSIYAWTGVFPKVVAASSTPTPLGSGGWIDRSDVVLRGELAGVGGAELVGHYGGTVSDHIMHRRANVDSYISTAGYASVSAAIQACIDENYTVEFSRRDYPITVPLHPTFSGQQFLGNWCRLVAQSDIAIWDITLTFRESCKWSRVGHASLTPGTGKGMYSASGVYLPTGVVDECSFEASLRYCVNSNIILMKFRDCDFGTYGTAGAIHQHIVTNGQNLSSGSNLTTNINAFQNCRFRKSKGTPYASEISDGFMYGFEMCDVEMNECTVAPFRFNGVLGVYFNDHCWFERNKSTYLASFGMDTVGTLQGCQIVNIDNCWLSLATESTHAFHSDTSNFAISVDHCAGTGFAGKKMLRVVSSDDPTSYMRSFFHNSFTGYTPGYNQDQLYSPYMVNPLSPNYIAKSSNPRYTLQNAAGLEQGAIIGSGDNTTGAAVIETAAGNVTIRNKSAANTVQFVRTANGTEIRCFSANGTQYRLTPPDAGGAATWVAV